MRAVERAVHGLHVSQQQTANHEEAAQVVPAQQQVDVPVRLELRPHVPSALDAVLIGVEKVGVRIVGNGTG